jgi:hypothetical protein
MEQVQRYIFENPPLQDKFEVPRQFEWKVHRTDLTIEKIANLPWETEQDVGMLMELNRTRVTGDQNTILKLGTPILLQRESQQHDCEWIQTPPGCTVKTAALLLKDGPTVDELICFNKDQPHFAGEQLGPETRLQRNTALYLRGVLVDDAEDEEETGRALNGVDKMDDGVFHIFWGNAGDVANECPRAKGFNRQVVNNEQELLAVLDRIQPEYLQQIRDAPVGTYLVPPTGNGEKSLSEERLAANGSNQRVRSALQPFGQSLATELVHPTSWCAATSVLMCSPEKLRCSVGAEGIAIYTALQRIIFLFDRG